MTWLNKRILCLSLGLSLVATSASANIFENLLGLPRSLHVTAPALSFEEANAMTSKTEKLFQPEIKDRGLDLITGIDWTSSKIETGIVFDGRSTTMLMNAGAFQQPKMNLDIAVLVLAHEYGHILGAGPRPNSEYITSEGEADYFAGSSGALKILNARIVADQTDLHSPEYVAAKKFLFSRGVRNSQELHTKARIAVAALLLNRTLAPGQRINFSTPDRSQVKETLIGYPSAQCRLDTVLAGLLKKERPACWALQADFNN